MSFGDIMLFIWDLMNTGGYNVMGVFISFGDILVFVVAGTLLIWLLVAIFGGDN